MRTLPLLAVLSVTMALHAQIRSGETIEVSIVNVDVVVTDRDGNRVRGLRADDFEIREGGKVQTITNFSEYRSDITSAAASVEAAPSPEAAAAARPPRTLVIFIEAVRLGPDHAKKMFDAMRALVRETVARGDRVTVLTWRNAVLVRQPFTDDVAAIERVLGEVEGEVIAGPRDMSRTVRDEQAASDADAEAMSAGGMPAVHALAAAKRQLYEIRQKARMLEALIHGLAALEGRKMIVMATRRFGVHAGREYFAGQIPLEERSQLDTTPIRDALIRTANAHGVTLYPLYPPGTAWQPDDAATRRDSFSVEGDARRGALEHDIMLNETTALDDLAVRTGGLMAWGSGNIAEMLPRVADDMESYYSLGYRSRATGKDVVRNIEVRVKNRDYRVRSRTQFVEKSDQTLMNDRVVANLYQRLEGSTLAFDVGFGEIRSAGRNKWQLPLKLRIPIGALTATPRGPQEVGEFTVYVVTGGVIGALSEVQRRTQPFHYPRSDAARAKASVFTYDLTLEIDDKVDRLSIGLMDETSKEYGLRRLAVPERPKK